MQRILWISVIIWAVWVAVTWVSRVERIHCQQAVILVFPSPRPTVVLVLEVVVVVVDVVALLTEPGVLSDLLELDSVRRVDHQTGPDELLSIITVLISDQLCISSHHQPGNHWKYSQCNSASPCRLLGRSRRECHHRPCRTGGSRGSTRSTCPRSSSSGWSTLAESRRGFLGKFHIISDKWIY